MSFQAGGLHKAFNLIPGYAASKTKSSAAIFFGFATQYSYSINQTNYSLSAVNNLSTIYNSGTRISIAVLVPGTNLILASAPTFIEALRIDANSYALSLLTSSSYPSLAIGVSSDGNFALTSTSTTSVSVYSINKSTGIVTLLNSLAVSVTPGAIKAHPSLPVFYVAATNATSSNIYVIQNNSGAISLTQNLQINAVLFGISQVIVSPDGLFAYSFDRFNNTLTVYSINQSNGALTQVFQYTPTGNVTYAGVISNDNKFLYVSGSSVINSYARNLITGELTQVSSISGVGTTFEIAINIDNSAIYLNGVSYPVNTNTGVIGGYYGTVTSPGSAVSIFTY